MWADASQRGAARHSDPTAALRERIEILEEENQQLRELLVPKVTFPAEWKLDVGETRVLSALYAARHACDVNRLLYALTYMRAGRLTEPVRTSVDIRLCKLRRKLRPFGVEILTVRGVGWSLSPESRGIIRYVLDRAHEALAS